MAKRPEPAAPSPGDGEPASWAGFTNRGNARQAARDFEGAIADFTRAIELAPGELAPWFNRGNARSLSGKAAAAIEDYSEAIRIDPGYAAAYARRGLARQRAGDLEGAERDLGVAIRLAPADPDPRGHRAAVRALRGDLAGARADCERALELAPAGWKHRAGMASLLESLQAARAESVREETRMAASKAKKSAKKSAKKAARRAAGGAAKKTSRKKASARKAPARKVAAKRTSRKAAPAKRAPAKKVAAKRASAKKVAAKRAPAKKVAAGKAPAGKAPAAGKRAKEPVKRTEALPSATEVVEEVLAAAGWQADRSDDDGWSTFYTAVDDGGPVLATVARLSEELQRFVLYVVFRESATAATLSEAAEFVARANWGLGDGNFEMSPESGEVRFKVALDYTGVPLAPLLVRNVILDAMDATEVYEQALTSVLRGEASARAAIEAAEGTM